MKSLFDFDPNEIIPMDILNISLHKYKITARRDPVWTATSKILPWSILLVILGKIIKCADDDTGKNSVMPCNADSKIKFWKYI